MSIYEENGYKNRREYLNDMADEFGVSRSTCYFLADMLGASEDFDGLLSALEDASDF